MITKFTKKNVTRIFKLIVVGFALLATHCGKVSKKSGDSTSPEYESENSDPNFIFTFSAKGTLLPWDIGIVKALWHHSSKVSTRRLALSGSSSGSIVSSFFACRGLNADSISELESHMHKFDKTIIDETARRAAMVLLGLPAEVSHDRLNEILKLVTLNNTCMPKLPLMIVAGNYELLENRSSRSLKGRDEKIFQPADNSVLAKSGEFLGRGCTYFVDPLMKPFIERIPPKERLCDIRWIYSSDDLRLAILASVSEPTYFPPVVEPSPAVIERSGYDTPPSSPLTARKYFGGAIMTVPIQDMKRSLPQAFSLSTGRVPSSALMEKGIQALSLFEIRPLGRRSAWWLDVEIPMSRQVWDRAGEADSNFGELVTAGFQQTLKCLSTPSSCAPQNAMQPELNGNISNTSGPKYSDLGAFTKRGFGAL